jgi:hypothetical protein
MEKALADSYYSNDKFGPDTVHVNATDVDCDSDINPLGICITWWKMHAVFIL